MTQWLLTQWLKVGAGSWMVRPSTPWCQRIVQDKCFYAMQLDGKGDAWSLQCGT